LDLVHEFGDDNILKLSWWMKFSNNCTADSHIRWYLTSEPLWQSLSWNIAQRYPPAITVS